MKQIGISFIRMILHCFMKDTVGLTRTPDTRRSVAIRVREMVADRASTDPTELPPLSEVLDVDALDVLIASMGDGAVSFPYAGYTVTVDSSRAVHVADPITTE